MLSCPNSLLPILVQFLQPTQVILWTRVTPVPSDQRALVYFRVATDSSLNTIVTQGGKLLYKSYLGPLYVSGKIVLRNCLTFELKKAWRKDNLARIDAVNALL